MAFFLWFILCVAVCHGPYGRSLSSCNFHEDVRNSPSICTGSAEYSKSPSGSFLVQSSKSTTLSISTYPSTVHVPYYETSESHTGDTIYSQIYTTPQYPTAYMKMGSHIGHDPSVYSLDGLTVRDLTNTAATSEAYSTKMDFKWPGGKKSDAGLGSDLAGLKSKDSVIAGEASSVSLPASAESALASDLPTSASLPVGASSAAPANSVAPVNSAASTVAPSSTAAPASSTGAAAASSTDPASLSSSAMATTTLTTHDQTSQDNSNPTSQAPTTSSLSSAVGQGTGRRTSARTGTGGNKQHPHATGGGFNNKQHSQATGGDGNKQHPQGTGGSKDRQHPQATGRNAVGMFFDDSPYENDTEHGEDYKMPYQNYWQQKRAFVALTTLASPKTAYRKHRWEYQETPSRSTPMTTFLTLGRA